MLQAIERPRKNSAYSVLRSCRAAALYGTSVPGIGTHELHNTFGRYRGGARRTRVVRSESAFFIKRSRRRALCYSLERSD